MKKVNLTETMQTQPGFGQNTAKNLIDKGKQVVKAVVPDGPGVKDSFLKGRFFRKNTGINETEDALKRFEKEFGENIFETAAAE